MIFNKKTQKKLLIFFAATVLLWIVGFKLVYPELALELHMIYNHGRTLVAIITAGISLLSVLSVTLLVGSTKSWQNVIVLLTIALTSFICISNVWITQDGLNYQSWSTALNNNDQVTRSSFFLNFAYPLFFSGILTIGYLIAHRLIKPLIAGLVQPIYAWLLFALSLSFCIATTQYSNGHKDSFHPILKSASTLAFYKRNLFYKGPRKTVLTPKFSESRLDTQNIWLIVDESIRFDEFEKTWNIQRGSIHNSSSISKYREVVSGAICSDYANALLLVGMSPHNLPDKDHNAFRLPTLFDYAKSAGYSTAWVNAYGNDLGTYGFFNATVLKSIDTVIIRQAIKQPLEPYEYDLALLNSVKRWAKKHPKTFIYVNKIGCHFPYSRYTSPEFKINKPTDKVATYQKCINYSVPSYFHNILSSTNEKRQIFYTSDHGQHLGEDPSIYLAHCARGRTHPTMASVPYLYITDSTNQYSVPNFNRPATHQSIFFDVIEALHPDFRALYDDQIRDQTIEYSSGDIFGRSKLYKTTFKNFK